MKPRFFLYGLLVILVLVPAWLYGGYMLYLSLYTLLLLPVASLVYAVILLAGLRVTLTVGDGADRRDAHAAASGGGTGRSGAYAAAFVGDTVVRGEPSRYRIQVRNFTPLINTCVRCRFLDDGFAIEKDSRFDFFRVEPFMRADFPIEYTPRCRGEFLVGPERIEVGGFLGLFTLKRRMHGAIKLTVLPRVLDMPDFPLAQLLSQSFSTFEIKEEDYATVSDIRPYLPDDSIKRVHWKLTASRGEWLVKNFQSNALNRIQILLNPVRPTMAREPALLLEDHIVETALAVARYCLSRQIPVTFSARAGFTTEGRLLGDFDPIYRMTAGIVFSEEGDAEDEALPLLERCLGGSGVSYRNILMATAILDAAFCQRAIAASQAGHLVAVVYFAADPVHAPSEERARLLLDHKVAVYRV